MEIVVLNGSAKLSDSVSGLLIEQIEKLTAVKARVYQANRMVRFSYPIDELKTIKDADVLLVVFPLYVDALPASVTQALSFIEGFGVTEKKVKPRVYAVCNCGFHEAPQTRLALKMVERFAHHAKMNWGYGIGIGCGGMLLSRSENLAVGPTADVYAAITQLCEEITKGGSSRENLFVTPKIPRFLYVIGGNAGWRQLAKKNGVQKTLRARPYLLK